MMNKKISTYFMTDYPQVATVVANYDVISDVLPFSRPIETLTDMSIES
jgi:hypothetical protein